MVRVVAMAEEAQGVAAHALSGLSKAQKSRERVQKVRRGWGGVGGSEAKAGREVSWLELELARLRWGGGRMVMVMPKQVQTGHEARRGGDRRGRREVRGVDNPLLLRRTWQHWIRLRRRGGGGGEWSDS